MQSQFVAAKKDGDTSFALDVFLGLLHSFEGLAHLSRSGSSHVAAYSPKSVALGL